MSKNELAIIHDYAAAGFRVFALHGIDAEGCLCGNPRCDAAGKHPAIKKWQAVPAWSDEALENMLEHSITTGYGVCIDNQLVIDVDPRNGGVESLAKLSADTGIDYLATAGFVVQTGGGGWHVYYTRPAGSYAQSLPEYPGIDFKTSGFVVGCGSLHRSGVRYERARGFPDDMTPAPDAILEKLLRRETNRALLSDGHIDITDAELTDIVSHIPDVDDYHRWVQVGMGIHHATGGAGIELWDKWSRAGAKYDRESIDSKWHSFGKSQANITLGSLIYMAKANGWVQPVTFPEDAELAAEIPAAGLFDTSHCDPLRPPGFTGRVTEWINEQSFYPREHLAVIAALTALGNACGLAWRDDITGVAPNLLSICIAGTGTGKESIQNCYAEIMRSAGLAATVHGEIKSKQEITRNLIDQQAANYCTDELGEMLKSITNAQKRGGAAYLEGIPGDLMKIFTKPSETLHISGDLRRETIKSLAGQIGALRAAMDENERVDMAHLDSLESLLRAITETGGIPRPYLSLIGFTTMASFEGALSVEMAQNGFINRAIIVEESDTNPKPNPRQRRQSWPYDMAMMRMAATGKAGGGRAEHYSEYFKIATEQAAQAALQAVQAWQWEFAEMHRETTGYESLARRAYEFVSKISLILSVADGGIRTVEHVEWATAYIKRDIDEKIRLIQWAASRDSKISDDVMTGLRARAISLAKSDGGIYMTNMIHSLRRKDITPENMTKFVTSLVSDGSLTRIGKKLFSSKTGVFHQK
jgi:hypothetical protein